MNVKKGKRYYEKNRNILIAISALLIVSTIILFIFIKESCHDAISYAGPNERETNRGVIIKVYEDSFAFMAVDGEPFYVIYRKDTGPFIDPEARTFICSKDVSEGNPQILISGKISSCYNNWFTFSGNISGDMSGAPAMLKNENKII